MSQTSTQKMSELRKAFMSAITPEEIQAIVQMMVWKAKHGDARALQVILPYLIGNPVKQTEIEKDAFIDDLTFQR